MTQARSRARSCRFIAIYQVRLIMNKVVKSSDSSIEWKLNCIKLISLCFNSFAFYTIFSRIYPDSVLSFGQYDVNYYGIFGSGLGVLLEFCKSGSAENIQAQKAKGDGHAGISALAFVFIFISICSTAFNGVTFVESIEKNKVEAINKQNQEKIRLLNLDLESLNLQRKNIISIISTQDGIIKRREADLNNGYRIDTEEKKRNLEPWRVTNFQKEISDASKEKDTQNKNLENKDSEIKKVNGEISNLKLIPLQEVSYFTESGLPKTPIILFILFGAFIEAIIFLYQRAISFVKPSDDDALFDDEIYSIHRRTLMIEKSKIEADKKRISELTLMLENQVKNMHQNNHALDASEPMSQAARCISDTLKGAQKKQPESAPMTPTMNAQKTPKKDASQVVKKKQHNKQITVTKKNAWSEEKIASYVTDRKLEPSARGIAKACGVSQVKASSVLYSLVESGVLYKDGRYFKYSDESQLSENIEENKSGENIVSINFRK